jgi:hypothetical protein
MQGSFAFVPKATQSIETKKPEAFGFGFLKVKDYYGRT